MTSDTGEGLWVRTEPDPITGTFMVAFNLDGDRAWALNRYEAREYAVTLLTICGAAEYDLAVLRQMTEHVKVGTEHAAQLVLDMRQERPLVSWCGPLSFTVIVTADKRALLAGHHQDDPEPTFQVDLVQARDHALAVLDAITAADLDNTYLKVLRNNLQLDEPRARNVVGDLSNWRSR